jgi:hypothetical protein
VSDIAEDFMILLVDKIQLEKSPGGTEREGIGGVNGKKRWELWSHPGFDRDRP